MDKEHCARCGAALVTDQEKRRTMELWRDSPDGSEKLAIRERGICNECVREVEAAVQAINDRTREGL
jgi:hypothetical protein